MIFLRIFMHFFYDFLGFFLNYSIFLSNLQVFYAVFYIFLLKYAIFLQIFCQILCFFQKKVCICEKSFMRPAVRLRKKVLYIDFVKIFTSAGRPSLDFGNFKAAICTPQVAKKNRPYAPRSAHRPSSGLKNFSFL